MRINSRINLTPIITCLLCCVLVGCSVVGPKSIRSGRMAYNEAISETNNQQILKIVVQDRYEERGSLLAVSSVTANVKISSRANIQAGFGSIDNYEGNLVPFSGGFIYEENPTISYVPVDGESYLRQLMAPLPISLLAQLSRNLSASKSSFYTLVSSVNGIYNPGFLNANEEIDPRFDRFATLVAELTEAHRLQWAQDSGEEGKFTLVIDQSDPINEGRARELQELAGLPTSGSSTNLLTIPVALAWQENDQGSLAITTRSVYELVDILAGAVDVPEEDLAAGVARRPAKQGLAGSELYVHHSDSKPDHAYIAVAFRDGWFYIDERDLVTKRYFKLLGALWSSTIADSTARQSAPVLTVPVSR
ncbi:hypothetical protein ACFL07_01825 [Pseudomonadota bacterium]